MARTWGYHAKTITNTTLDRWDDFAAGRRNPAAHERFALGDSEVWHSINHNFPTVNDDGSYLFKRVSGDRDVHTMVGPYALASGMGDPNLSNRGLIPDRTYRVCGRFRIPDNGLEWWKPPIGTSWVNIHQHWGWYDQEDSGLAPCIGLYIDAGAGEWSAVFRADSRLAHSLPYEVFSDVRAPFVMADFWEYEITHRPSLTAGVQQLRLWQSNEGAKCLVIDTAREGLTMYNSERRSKLVGPYVFWGAYTNMSLADPGIQIVFDEMTIDLLD